MLRHASTPAAPRRRSTRDELRGIYPEYDAIVPTLTR